MELEILPKIEQLPGYNDQLPALYNQTWRGSELASRAIFMTVTRFLGAARPPRTANQGNLSNLSSPWTAANFTSGTDPRDTVFSTLIQAEILNFSLPNGSA